MFRKIIAPKFFITLPKAWRESLELQPGGYVDARFSSGSPLIIVPKGHDLTNLEHALIGILTGPGSLSRAEIERILACIGMVGSSLRELLKAVD